ncbi:MAG: cytochrome c biogenesis protein CcsA [Bacteroidales bacterium]|nr:cytochrome c biogenesis protein CcsA [Bacteroidales bacterium]
MNEFYSGEHLLSGYFGKTMIILGFILVLISMFAYYQASHKQADRRQWKKIGRYAYYGHFCFLVFSSMALLFIILRRYYEYKYVWSHVSSDLSIWYMTSSFWAGQEGSFLFWASCQALIGLILIKTLREWESPVMTFWNIAQSFMTSMIMGISVFGLQIGRSPFQLLRLSPENLSNPFFENPEYLSLLSNGNGLNPLLQNFWMLSHPPVLFIGFSLVLVTFCFVAASLWTKEFRKWIRPALPWTIAGVLFLGAGLLLGGVWAYESLTFGGFWAWDPIENASLVPWLLLVAALHLMIISRKTNTHWMPTYILSALAFIFVIYSTFLTRSGILGATSVHAFGNDDMAMHILFFLFSILGIFAYLFIRSISQLPKPSAEKLFSKEFIMFVASLVIILAAFQISFTTSIPVINKVFGTQLAPPANIIDHYNNWQMPFALIIMAILAVAQYLQFGKNNTTKILQQLKTSLLLSILLTIVFVFTIPVKRPIYVIFMFAGLFSAISSIILLVRYKKDSTNIGSVISHLGFSMLMLSILFTFSNSSTISRNTSGVFLGRQFPDNENLLLAKDEILPMGDYYVTYKGKNYSGNRIYFNIDFLNKVSDDKYQLRFTSHPSVLLNNNMGNVYEPYTNNLINKDIFTYVSYAELNTNTKTKDKYKEAVRMPIHLNDSVQMSDFVIKLIDIETDSKEANLKDIKIVSVLEIKKAGHIPEIIRPAFILKDEIISHEDALSELTASKIRFAEVSEIPNTIVLEVSEKNQDYIIIKSKIFPYINLLWISCFIFIFGLSLAVIQRIKKMNKKHEKGHSSSITIENNHEV